MVILWQASATQTTGRLHSYMCQLYKYDIIIPNIYWSRHSLPCSMFTSCVNSFMYCLLTIVGNNSFINITSVVKCSNTDRSIITY